ncbi:MAG: hypothetical protein HYZ72_00130, partial [Deltaproteobacteria bacterium]|nr:hypothetical protein [Deltaproteobacteria bacterium]
MLRQVHVKAFGLKNAAIFAAFSLLVVPLFIGQARARPLCEGLASVVCREDVEDKIDPVIDNLIAGVPNERDRRNAVNSLNDALDAFFEARIDRDDSTLAETVACGRASDEDARALKRAARGVRDAFKIPLSKFSSAGAFATTRTRLRNLALSMIDAVDNNLDEIEALGGFDANHLATARARIARARRDFNRNLL